MKAGLMLYLPNAQQQKILVQYNPTQLQLQMQKYSKKTNQQILGRIAFHDQISISENVQRSNLSNDNRKVLILHTGGTIGMFKDEHNKFRPQKSKFKQFLQNYPYFSDEDETYFLGENEFTITPQTIFKKKIWYQYLQLPTLIDSTNMSLQRLNHLLSLIKEHYNKYDAFIILHGTDTMSYTASALSFMIENLKKTIIITGAQIPIGQTRNDGVSNLLCALTVAGHYIIPQVLLVFNNTILRGNRTTKSSASSFASFSSPNFYPIGTMGLTIDIRWEMIPPSRPDLQTVFHPLTQEVSLIKLTPFGYSARPTSRYIVIESFGVGNIPTEGEFYEWAKQNSKKPRQEQVVIVNISQVSQSVILNIYATGDQAEKLGMISGSDMTCEAAVAKLSYLASRGLKNEQIRTEMVRNLRGQLTETQDRTATDKENFAANSLMMLEKGFAKQSSASKEILHQVVFPLITSQNPTNLSLSRMKEFGLDIHKIHPNGKTLLHQLCNDKSIPDQVAYLEWLFKQEKNPKDRVQMSPRANSDMNGFINGFSFNRTYTTMEYKERNQKQKEKELELKNTSEIIEMKAVQKKMGTAVDQEGCSALWYALLNRKEKLAKKIFQNDGKLIVSSQKVFHQIRSNNLPLLVSMCQYKDAFEYKNAQGRGCLMYSLLLNSQPMVDFFIQNTDLSNEDKMSEKDIYGKDTWFYQKKSSLIWGSRKISDQSEDSSKNS